MMQLPEVQRKDYKSTFAEPWQSLKTFTAARIALGRTGNSVPLKEAFDFKLAHANARDAVYSVLNVDGIYAQLKELELPTITVKSRAASRTHYLQRPDLGRQLEQKYAAQLQEMTSSNFDISLIVADGLSATAVNEHAVPLLNLVVPQLKMSGFQLSPIAIAEQARVALCDAVGEALQAKMTIILVGERPGLSTTNSMSAYLTFSPHCGCTDEARNCISNIHPGGLSYEFAARKILYLVRESFQRKLSGVRLKDEMGLLSEVHTIAEGK